MALRFGELGAVSVFALTVLAIIIYNFKCWHVIQEGNVGFYYKFGKMQDAMTEPGLHFTFPPPITTSIQVYVRPQVDSVKHVKCGAKDGTNIEFPSIEIGNTLPIDKAHGVIKEYGADYDKFLVYKQVQYVTNGLCSQFTSHEIAIEKFNDMDDHIKKQLEDIQAELKTGLKIGFVRIAKPRLPEHLSDAYQRQAKERALKKAKEEEFKRIQQENLNDEEKVRGVSQRELLQSKKQNEINIAKKKSEQQQDAIDNQMKLDSAKTEAEIVRENAKARADAIREEANANRELLTEAYLSLKKYEGLLANNKLVFGSIPDNVFLNEGGANGECSAPINVKAAALYNPKRPMALQHTRLISKVFKSRLYAISQRPASDSGTGGAPYRPYPATKYQWSESADHWTQNGYKPQSEEDDQYEVEEIYLSEIEERLQKYDKKYCDSDKVKALYNEFGWEAIDDRATHNYGGSLGGTQYGEGKKINPAHYVTASWTNVGRKAIPPIQYMTADQIRRSRGSLASVREVPPELDSIWKYWNFYSCLGVFGTIMISKEFFVTGGHDMFEGLMMWGIFGTVASFAADWYAWWHTLLLQEAYDREYFPLIKAVNKYNKELENINCKPNEKKIMFQMQKYREIVAEKVLKKTLQNRLGRSIESTLQKLESKMSEEGTTKKEAENQWKRKALQETVDFFDNDAIRSDFMKDALAQFCSDNNAAISNTNATVHFKSDLFESKYNVKYNEAQNDYLNEQRNKGILSAVFMDANERMEKYKSIPDKEETYLQKVNVWASSRNSVNTSVPSFS